MAAKFLFPLPHHYSELVSKARHKLEKRRSSKDEDGSAVKVTSNVHIKPN